MIAQDVTTLTPEAGLTAFLTHFGSVLSLAVPPGMRLRLELEHVSTTPPQAVPSLSVTIPVESGRVATGRDEGAEMPTGGDAGVGDAPGRRPGEDDLAYLERLTAAGQTLDLTASDWSRQLPSISRRALMRAKREGLVSWTRRGHTRGGNAELIPAGDVLRLLRLREQVEDGRVAKLPRGYEPVFGPAPRARSR